MLGLRILMAGARMSGVVDALARATLGDLNVQMVKIQIPDRSDRGKALVEAGRRGRVICLPDNVFVVPEPALALLQSLGIAYQELGRGGLDYAEKALRDAAAAQV
jgi:hypothetical protein